MIKYQASELRLADIVQLDMDAYGTATIEKITQDNDRYCISFFRPYTMTSDFSYTGEVICYVGIERWGVRASPTELFTVVQRKELK